MSRGQIRIAKAFGYYVLLTVCLSQALGLQVGSLIASTIYIALLLRHWRQMMP